MTDQVLSDAQAAAEALDIAYNEAGASRESAAYGWVRADD